VTREGLEQVLVRIGAPHNTVAISSPGEQIAPGLTASLAGTFLPDA